MALVVAVFLSSFDPGPGQGLRKLHAEAHHQIPLGCCVG